MKRFYFNTNNVHYIDIPQPPKSDSFVEIKVQDNYDDCFSFFVIKFISFYINDYNGQF